MKAGCPEVHDIYVDREGPMNVRVLAVDGESVRVQACAWKTGELYPKAKPKKFTEALFLERFRYSGRWCGKGSGYEEAE
jgi:hypothetical protein